MKRYRPIILSVGILMLVAGCDQSTEPRANAEVAKGQLMPVDSPGDDPIYVANQSNVKLVPKPDISYDSLDGFRSDNAARYQRMLDRYRAVERAEKQEATDDAADSAEGEGGGFINAEEVDRMRNQGDSDVGSSASEEQKADDNEDNDLGDDDQDDDEDDLDDDAGDDEDDDGDDDAGDDDDDGT